MITFRLLLNENGEVLSEKTRNRRVKLCQVNLKVTIMVWLAEFFGCMTMAIDFLIIGSQNNAVTGLLRTLTMLTYFVLLPVTFFLNCSETKETIIDYSWRMALAGALKTKDKMEKDKVSEESSIRPSKQDAEVKGDPIPGSSKDESSAEALTTLAGKLENRKGKPDSGGVKENVQRRIAWT